jgi:hypothetical protein
MLAYIIALTLIVMLLCCAVRLHLSLGLHRLTEIRAKEEMSHDRLW